MGRAPPSRCSGRGAEAELAARTPRAAPCRASSRRRTRRRRTGAGPVPRPARPRGRRPSGTAGRRTSRPGRGRASVGPPPSPPARRLPLRSPETPSGMAAQPSADSAAANRASSVTTSTCWTDGVARQAVAVSIANAVGELVARAGRRAGSCRDRAASPGAGRRTGQALTREASRRSSQAPVTWPRRVAHRVAFARDCARPAAAAWLGLQPGRAHPEAGDAGDHQEDLGGRREHPGDRWLHRGVQPHLARRPVDGGALPLRPRPASRATSPSPGCSRTRRSASSCAAPARSPSSD